MNLQLKNYKLRKISTAYWSFESINTTEISRLISS